MVKFALSYRLGAVRGRSRVYGLSCAMASWCRVRPAFQLPALLGGADADTGTATVTKLNDQLRNRSVVQLFAYYPLLSFEPSLGQFLGAGSLEYSMTTRQLRDSY